MRRGRDKAKIDADNDYAVRILKKGLYRFDSEPAQLRVYDGEAQVESGGSWCPSTRDG